MSKASNIVLIGFMGTGKTSVGRELARTLGMHFVDMDDVIVERAKKTIPEIFEEDGEAHFRATERQVAKDLADKQGLVIATGGGVVLNPDNMRDFYASGLVVCLSATPETILARVETDTNRPLLAGTRLEKMAKIEAILNTRRSLYDAIPHQIDTSTLSIDQIVAAVRALPTTPSGRPTIIGAGA